MDHIITYLLLLAQAGDLSSTIAQYVKIVSNIAMFISFVAVVLAGVMVASGRLEHLGHAIAGAVLSAIAWILVTVLFGAAGITSTIQL